MRKPPIVVAFHVVYTYLAIQFFVTTLAYTFAPATSLAQYVRLGAIMGGVPYGHTEDSVLWRVLALANVTTLAFGCAFIQLDLRRWWGALPPLLVLKGTATIGFLVAWLAEPFPGHLAGFAVDAVTVMADVLSDFSGPVVIGFPSGHTTGPAMTLPFGV